MLYVDHAQCTGCAVCVEACPTGAISLDEREDVATIDLALCNECLACLDVCPTGAIQRAESSELVPAVEGEVVEGEVVRGEVTPTVEAVGPARSEQIEPAIPRPANVVRVKPQITALSPRNWALPAIGSALLWTGREVVPRLASLALALWDRRTRPAGQVALGRKGDRQRRRRQRRRGNW